MPLPGRRCVVCCKKRPQAVAAQTVVWPEVSAAFVAAMEDELDLYEAPYDPQRPPVNFDETNKPLIAETRVPLPARSGQPARYDYEYKRHGTRNLFLFCEP